MTILSSFGGYGILTWYGHSKGELFILNTVGLFSIHIRIVFTWLYVLGLTSAPAVVRVYVSLIESYAASGMFNSGLKINRAA